MAGIFEPVTMTWGGRDYTIPADRVMRAIASVEDVFTLVDLHRYMATGSPPLAKISSVYAMLLRYAGAKVSDEEVYAGMFDKESGSLQANATNAIMVLLQLMLPPGHLKMSASKEGAEGDAGKAKTSTADQ